MEDIEGGLCAITVGLKVTVRGVFGLADGAGGAECVGRSGSVSSISLVVEEVGWGESIGIGKNSYLVMH